MIGSRAAHGLVSVVLLAGCASSVTPQRHYVSAQNYREIAHSDSPEHRAMKDYLKRATTSDLVTALKTEFGPDIVTSITVRKMPGRDFHASAVEFSELVGAPILARKGSLLLEFDLRKVEGWFSGPTIRNYRLVVFLLRPVDQYKGEELVRLSVARFRCTTKADKPGFDHCDEAIPRFAEEALYSFRPVDDVTW